MELVTDEVFKKNMQNEQSMVHPFVWENVQRFGIDLTVGEICIDVTRGQTISLEKGQGLEIRPSYFVIVHTNESLDMGGTHIGQVFPKVSLTLKGLSQSGGKVDPEFRGQLKVALKNEGPNSVTLKRGEPICNVAFWRIE